MKNAKPQLAIDPDTWKKVGEYAEQSGLKTANTLMSAVAVEVAKAHANGVNVWQMLGRIAADGDEPERKRLPGARPALEIAR